MSAWALIWAYWLALGVLTVVSAVRGSIPMLRTSLVLCANCLFQLALAQFIPTDALAHAAIMFCADALACIAITLHPAGKWQSLVGFSYILQCGFHVGRIISPTPDIFLYWDRLTFTAYLQLAFLGGWLIYVGLGSPNWKLHRDTPPSKARDKSVA